MTRTPPRESLLETMADDLGDRVALEFAQDYGGVILYVPKTATDHFKSRVGVDVAIWLCQRHAACQIEVPLGPFASGIHRTAKLRRAIEEDGSSASALARRFGVTSRTVKRHRRAVRESDDSLPLFSTEDEER